MTGGPARGWYPKQRQNRPASTENLDRINAHGSCRPFDTGSNTRKPLTLPPNLSPNFFNKSPREALRRVTSLLIRKGVNGKESNKKEKEKDNVPSTHRSFDSGKTPYLHIKIQAEIKKQILLFQAQHNRRQIHTRKRDFSKVFGKNRNIIRLNNEQREKYNKKKKIF